MITRYHMMWNKDEDGSIYVSPWPSGQSGDWVKYEDYVMVQDELARLRASSFVTAVPVEEYERLKAEVERLNDAIMRGDSIPDARPQ